MVEITPSFGPLTPDVMLSLLYYGFSRVFITSKEKKKSREEDREGEADHQKWSEALRRNRGQKEIRAQIGEEEFVLWFLQAPSYKVLDGSEEEKAMSYSLEGAADFQVHLRGSEVAEAQVWKAGDLGFRPSSALALLCP